VVIESRSNLAAFHLNLPRISGAGTRQAHRPPTLHHLRTLSPETRHFRIWHLTSIPKLIGMAAIEG
jgi:hypothetical protein